MDFRNCSNDYVCLLRLEDHKDIFEHFYTSCNTLNYLTGTVAQSQQAQLATDKHTDFCCFFFFSSFSC